MREIESAEITNAVRELCIEANTRLPEDHLSALRRALEEEESSLGREVIGELLENARVARERCVAFCQDTGYAVFFVELGSEVRVVRGELGQAIDEGVRRGYDEERCEPVVAASAPSPTTIGPDT